MEKREFGKRKRGRKVETTGKSIEEERRKGKIPEEGGTDLMEKCITSVQGCGEDDGLAGSRSGSLDRV